MSKLSIKKLSHEDDLFLQKVMADTSELPYVGIFWYSPQRNELFGVVKHHLCELKQKSGKVTVSELHKNVWKKYFNHYKYHPAEENLYYHGDYKLKPRGRIFYDYQTGVYQVCVGSWIEDCDEEVAELLIKEFNLPEDKTEFNISEHWEIGCGWGD